MRAVRYAPLDGTSCPPLATSKKNTVTDVHPVPERSSVFSVPALGHRGAGARPCPSSHRPCPPARRAPAPPPLQTWDAPCPLQ
eukprot:1744863-Prymnesium_polylepis.1